MTFTVTTPAPRQVWRRLCEEDPDALVSQSPEWIDAVCAWTGRRDASRLYERPDGLKVVFPLVRRPGLPSRLSVLESMPAAWGFGGPLSNRPLEAGDLRAVIDDVAGRRPLRLRVRPNPLHASTWAGAVTGLQPATARRRAHVLDLGGGFDDVWRQRFTSGTRNNARNARRRGVTVECDTTGRLVPVFHRLLRQSIDRWADQQHEPRLLAQWRGGRRDPEPKFDALAAALGNAFRLWVAWYQGSPAAAIVVLQGRNAHYTRGAMDKALAAESHANSLLHLVAIEDACRAGCRWYHMGESGGSEGLSRFKARFGATAVDYQEYAFEALPLTRADQALRRAVKRVVGFREAPLPAPVPAAVPVTVR